MIEGSAGPARVFSDTCCLLNVYATRHFEAILQALPARFAIADAVAADALYVRRGGAGADANERELLDLNAFVRAGLLDLLHLERDDEMGSTDRYPGTGTLCARTR